MRPTFNSSNYKKLSIRRLEAYKDLDYNESGRNAIRDRRHCHYHPHVKRLGENHVFFGFCISQPLLFSFF